MINQLARTGNPAREVTASVVCGSPLWSSPARRPAGSAVMRVVDWLMPRSGWPVCLYFIGVTVLLVAAGHVVGPAGLAMIAVAAFAGGAWCSVNFWRCRHAHCVVTGAGWLALAGVSLVGAVVGHSLIGGVEEVVFLAILALGAVFELGWYLACGSHAITPKMTGNDPK